MAHESGPKQFRAIDTFGSTYPNKKVKKWEYVDKSNYNIIRVFTESEVLIVEYNPESNDISVTTSRIMADVQEAHSHLCCPKCGSNHVNVQVVSESQLRNKHHGCIWWLVIGWWWLPVKWVFFTFPALIFKLFMPKRQKIVTQHFTMNVCQSCGHSWKA